MITLYSIILNMRLSILFFVLMAMFFQVNAQKVKLNILKDAAYFLEGKDSVLVYRASDTSLDGEFVRSNYVHPLFNLNGSTITEDFPEDHRHHRGVFWAWHQLYVGNTRIGDGWELKDFRWDVISMRQLKSESKSTSLQTTVLWKSPLWLDDVGDEKPLVHETTTISVYPKNNNVRIIDFQIELLGLETDMKLGGSEDDKGYGGFSWRTKLPEDIQFFDNKEELEPQNLPISGGAWLTMSGTMDSSGDLTQLVIIPHKENPGYPNPWILRSKASMQNAVFPYPGAIPVVLSTQNPTVLRYRLLISDGSILQEDIQKFQDSYFNK